MGPLFGLFAMLRRGKWPAGEGIIATVGMVIMPGRQRDDRSLLGRVAGVVLVLGPGGEEYEMYSGGEVVASSITSAPVAVGRSRVIGSTSWVHANKTRGIGNGSVLVRRSRNRL